MDADQSRIPTGRGDGVGHHLAVILFVDPSAACQINAGKKVHKSIPDRCALRDVGAGEDRSCRHIGLRAVIFRRIVDKRRQRNIACRFAVFQEDKPAGVGHLADRHEVEVPFLEDLPRRIRRVGLQDHQHPFLAFREHQFIGTHAFLAGRNQIEVHFHAEAAFGRHFDRG